MENLDLQIFNGYKNKLVNNLYALLCEKENKGQWKKFYDSIYIEIMGQEKELNCINYWKLRGKLSSLEFLSYVYFRKTIFECINLLEGVKKDELL